MLGGFSRVNDFAHLVFAPRALKKVPFMAEVFRRATLEPPFERRTRNRRDAPGVSARWHQADPFVPPYSVLGHEPNEWPRFVVPWGRICKEFLPFRPSVTLRLLKRKKSLWTGKSRPATVTKFCENLIEPYRSPRDCASLRKGYGC
jgi:hypothetical protein